MSLPCLIRLSLQLQNPIKYSVAAACAQNIFPSVERSVSARFSSYTQSLKSVEPEPVEDGVEKEKTGDTAEALTRGRTIQKIPVETGIRYLQSKAYSITYGVDPVWKNYRRNFKGGIPPNKTRKTCTRQDKISTGNPCPVCRDDYLVLSPKNIELLKQFISPHTGETLNYTITGVCQKKHKELLSVIDIAKDSGVLTFDVPFRIYDYSEYKNCV